MVLIGGHIYLFFSMGFRGQPGLVLGIRRAMFYRWGSGGYRPEEAFAALQITGHVKGTGEGLGFRVYGAYGRIHILGLQYQSFEK